MSETYERDFYTWAKQQADLARARSSNQLDWDNVAEELEGLSRSEYRELRSNFVILIAHLLKWIVQPERRGRSWLGSIAEQRREIAAHLGDNPGLRSREQEAFGEAYTIAVARATAETELEESAFPAAAPFTLEQSLDGAWLPD